MAAALPIPRALNSFRPPHLPGPNSTLCQQVVRGGAGVNAVPPPANHAQSETKCCPGNPLLPRKFAPGHIAMVCFDCTVATEAAMNAPGGVVPPYNDLTALYRQLHRHSVCNNCRKRELLFHPGGRDTCICLERVRGWKCHACLHDAYDQTYQLSQAYEMALLNARRTRNAGHRTPAGLCITRLRHLPLIDARCRCGSPRTPTDIMRDHVKFCLGCRGTISRPVPRPGSLAPPRGHNPFTAPPEHWPCLDEPNGYEDHA
ncbi:MAG: hypothetical protein Q9187_008223 [Circinaria calcarea]